MVKNTTSKRKQCTITWYKRILHIVTLLLVVMSIMPTSLDAKRRRKRRYRNAKKTAQKTIAHPNFSQTYSKFFDHTEQNTETDDTSSYLWEQTSQLAFDELILSWNALRPDSGKITFFVSVKHDSWSPWHRIAEWGHDFQRTFVNKLNPYVHTKHVRVEMQRGKFATAFKIKAVFTNGAPKCSLNALFACVANMKLFKICMPNLNRPSLAVEGVPQQSQMINHPRAQDLCSPASTSMIINYFARKLYGPNSQLAATNMRNYLTDFAAKVHDNGPLNIYGNWLLNVAQAHDSSNGKIFYRVERLNNFNELYNYLLKEIPVAVSVRRLKGGATPYSNGHFMVVVGWNRAKKTVICIDPAFKKNKATLKSYKISHFLTAWGLSRNLSYIPIPREDWTLGN